MWDQMEWKRVEITVTNHLGRETGLSSLIGARYFSSHSYSDFISGISLARLRW